MPFVDDPQSLAAIFGSVLPIETVVPFGDPGAPEDHVVFEWIGLVDYLNESKGGKRTRGANVTSVDAAIRYLAWDGAVEIALIEWKYTEAYPSPSPKHDAAKNATRRFRYENLWGSVVRTDLLDLEDLFVEPIYQMLRQRPTHQHRQSSATAMPTSSWSATELGIAPLDWPALGYTHGDTPKPRLVRDEPWREALGPQWFTADQLSSRGLCAWNHTEADAVRATRLVVTENAAGVQDSRACCDGCFESVLRYVDRPTEG